MRNFSDSRKVTKVFIVTFFKLNAIKQLDYALEISLI